MGHLCGTGIPEPVGRICSRQHGWSRSSALTGSLIDYGINDDFIKSLAETIPPNSSALFILVRKAQPEKILAELPGVKGKVLRTSLSPEQEKKLKEALEGATAHAAG
jgi:uncharacterized membrane protein